MSDKSNVRLRRFESLPTPVPEAVTDLPEDHPAMVGMQPLFEDQVFKADEVENIFVSGVNNRKIGKTIQKGPWRGLPIFVLTLPERMTCPETCHMLAACYGNAMPRAKRILPGPELEKRIRKDIARLAERYPNGFVIRLHILGDFYSEEYAQLWRTLMYEHKALHVYGYTARLLENDDPIAEILSDIRKKYSNRWMVRWSRPEPEPFSAIVVGSEGQAAQYEDVFLCPAEQDLTACCATCGLCWEPKMTARAVAFLKHGLVSQRKVWEVSQIMKQTGSDIREIKPIEGFDRYARIIAQEPPRFVWVDPRTQLMVAAAYQRDISRASVKRIQKIVREWDWTKFKPPIVVMTDQHDKYFVIDGQHTSIAAASHPGVEMIPVMLHEGLDLAEQAEAFLGHNMGSTPVTPYQVYQAQLTAQDPIALQVQEVIERSGVKVLPYPPSRGQFKPGETMSIKQIIDIVRTLGGTPALRILTILKEAGITPISHLWLRTMARLLYAPEFKKGMTDKDLLEVLKTVPVEKFMRLASDLKVQTGVALNEALGVVIHNEVTLRRRLKKEGKAKDAAA